jgi:hypothetical protein
MVTSIRRFGELILMTGWIVPFWLSGSTLLDYVRVEIAPRLAGAHPLNSFPFVDFAGRCFSAGCLWLAIAMGCRFLRTRSGKTNP